MSKRPAPRGRHTGISNRETPETENRERQLYPPIDESSPQPEDAAGRRGERPLADRRDRHTSHKAGSRSVAQKMSESRYPDRPMPAARKVAGAFGREPRAVSGAASEGSGATRRDTRKGTANRKAKATRKG